MDYKTINYTLTVAVSSQEAIEIIMILTENYPALFKTCNIHIEQTNNSNYTNLIMLCLEFKKGLYEELVNFENDIIDKNLLPNQFKIVKENI